MRTKLTRTIFWIVLGLAALILVAGGLLLVWRGGLALRLVDHYSADTLQEEILTMDECAECHEGPDYHRCSTCHDDHGAIEFADLPFFNLISISGDVPQPGYVELNQILPYRNHPQTHVKLVDFLSDQGAADFESVTLTSGDGGFVTISRENLSDQALLLPFSDGVRFAAEDLHVSTWLKGITGMIVVGEERDLLLDGEPTSIGRLLLGPTRQVTVESAKVMYASDLDGQIREAQTAARIWGAAVSELAAGGEYSSLTVRSRSGLELVLTPEEFRQAVLVSAADGPTLVLPDKPRSDWVREVTALEWEEK